MMTTGCSDYDSPIYIEAARRQCGDQMQAFLKRVDFGRVPVDTSAVAGGRACARSALKNPGTRNARQFAITAKREVIDA